MCCFRGLTQRTTELRADKPTHAVLAVALLVLAGCAGTPARYPQELAAQEQALAPRWYAPPLPHDGKTTELTQWWQRWADPVLADLIAGAQELGPSIAAARAQVEAARAAVAGVEVAGRPQVSAVANAVREPSIELPLGTTLSAGLQASWTVDLWGGNAASVRAARADEASAGAGWHAARVLVAAETAQAYYGYRLCLRQLAVVTDDRASRERTARSNDITEQAGFTAPAVAALARASAADGRNRQAQQQAVCEQQLKGLVALTGMSEPQLRQQLSEAPPLPGHGALQSMLSVRALPADVIRQRPDVYRAQQDLMAAAEGVHVSQAALWPSLSLSGNVMRNRFSGGGTDITLNSWSVGPFTLSLPLLGREGLRAQASAAEARYEAAARAYAATLRQAVAEVEQSLVAQSSLAARVEATATAVDGYDRSLRATEARYRVGLANLNELEEARRLKLAADSASVALLQERIQAWIALYVALGGGFDPRQALSQE
ncbi:MAG TPA: RND transporter [Comamonadaceae bacterium]|nr:RND transporter [Comamonadaceae bacterium]